MPQEMECKDGFCQLKTPIPAVKPEHIFFAPIEEPAPPEPEKQPETPTIRQKFLDYCEQYPYDIECKIYDV